MTTKLIVLNRIADAKEFIQIAQNTTHEVLLSSVDDKYRVDGKSILGIFSLDLSNAVKLSTETEQDMQMFEKFFNE